jgi:hypothetical protein
VVHSVPVASFDVLNILGRLQFAEVMFTNTSMYATSYLWDFGDGNTSNLISPVHRMQVKEPISFFWSPLRHLDVQIQHL